jgi:cytochrome c-type biogenesis protein CcmH
VRRTALVLAGAVAVVAAAALLAASPQAGPRTTDDRVQDIASGLRCPVCANLSVADSPSRLAGEMRVEIAARARAGQTDDQIRAFFVERYGEWILLEPTRRGLNLLPFAIPVAGVVIGLGVWFALVRRRPRRDDTAVSDTDRSRIERALASLEEAQ